MRVAIFSEVYWPMVSGVSRTLDRLVGVLRGTGAEARVYSATYPLPDGVVDRPDVHRSPSRPLFLSPEVQWAFPRRREVLADLAAFRPDVVHVATEFALGLTGVRCAESLGVPVVASSHTDYERYATHYGVPWLVGPGWTYLRWFYSRAQRVLCPTRLYAAHLHARGVPHTGIWGRGVDTDLFHPVHRSEAWRRLRGFTPDDLVVLYVGRLGPEKGIGVLLDAWERLCPRADGTRLVFVGAGLMEPEIARRGLPTQVLGMRHGPELSAAYASADVFVLPSATETFGNVLLEAMASGLPSVVAAAGGPTEFATHGENVLFVPPNDAAALADGLARLLADAGLRARLARGARATALRLSWAAACEPVIEAYRAALAERQAERAA
jgi:glycosyltransferase involved in cell wall biosynthesis